MAFPKICLVIILCSKSLFIKFKVSRETNFDSRQFLKNFEFSFMLIPFWSILVFFIRLGYHQILTQNKTHSFLHLANVVIWFHYLDTSDNFPPDLEGTWFLPPIKYTFKDINTGCSASVHITQRVVLVKLIIAAVGLIVIFFRGTEITGLLTFLLKRRLTKRHMQHGLHIIPC